MKTCYRIGIDPGKKTGFAVWNLDLAELEVVMAAGIIEVIGLIDDMLEVGHDIELTFEDARLRTWFGNSGREKLQGAGSIKRDCTIWEEFCKSRNIPNTAVKPAAGATKWSATKFERITGWTKRTSEHSRDAALLVYGAKA